MSAGSDLRQVERAIVACERCPRLRAHCVESATVKRRAYREEAYWGRPVPGFGDPAARILIVGLAPAAHGANRTGRMFTGDRSGEWLWAALHRAGLATRPESISREDGLKLEQAFLTAVCRCAPPGNRPERSEMAACSDYLDREIEALAQLRVVVALGGIAWEALLRRASRVAAGRARSPRPRFGHGAHVRIPLRAGQDTEVDLFGCYHPSQQNTFTGRLTRPMLDSVLRSAVRCALTPTRA